MSSKICVGNRSVITIDYIKPETSSPQTHLRINQKDLHLCSTVEERKSYRLGLEQHEHTKTAVSFLGKTSSLVQTIRSFSLPYIYSVQTNAALVNNVVLIGQFICSSCTRQTTTCSWFPSISVAHQNIFSVQQLDSWNQDHTGHKSNQSYKATNTLLIRLRIIIT